MYQSHRLLRSTRKTLHFLLISVLLLMSVLLPWPAQPTTQAASSGTPLLLIVNQASSNPFGRYLGELLRAEGLSSFDTIELSALTQAELLSHDVALLAETSLSASQASLLSSYVQGGGALLAMRPDPQIAGLFGLSAAAGTVSDAYVQINTAQLLGSGLSPQTLQTHSLADRYTSVTSTTIAQLYSTATAPANAPAVVRSITLRTAAFTYDLAQAVVLLRQGNPANANLDVDGDGTFRSNDLFRGVGTSAPWINLDRLPVPQADLQQRLFARLIHDLLGSPMPQLWYFPGQTKTVLVLTGDAHANPLSYYQQQLSSLSAHNAPITLYLTLGGGMTDSDMQAFRAQGHEFGIHPYTYRPDSYPPYNITNLTEGFQVFDTWYRNTWSSLPSRSYRTHRLGWQGWTDAASIAANQGYALDTNFYHWGSWLRRSDGSWPLGYLTGSGQPMKFAQADGTILPVYQQLTQLVDEFMLADITSSYQSNYGWVLPQYTAAQALAVSTALVDASQNGDYAALMTQFHTDYYGFGGPQAWAEGLVDYAHSQGIPVWNADTFLSFVETRAATSYTNVSWNATTGTLGFEVRGPSAAGTTLSSMLPASTGNRGLASVTVDGSPVSWTVQMIAGQPRAFVSLPAGNHNVQASYQVGAVTPTAQPSTPTATTLPSTPTATTLPSTPTATMLPSTPTATAVLPTSIPTSTPTLPATGSLIHTTLADWSQSCQLSSQMQATVGGEAGDGALVLSAATSESFDGSSLNPALWTSGSWSGGSYSPTLAGSQLTLPPGGYVRAAQAASVTELAVTASFGAGPWQHLGLANLDFSGDRYLLFSTYNSSNSLYVRVNNGSGEQQLNLGPIPSGSHRYRIVRRSLDTNTDQVSFLIDGVLQGSLTVANPGLNSLYTYLSNNAGNGANLVVDAVASSPSFASSGSLTSCVLDAGAGQTWQTLSWDALLASSTGLTVAVRSSADGSSWGAWQPISTSGSSMPSSARYGQYQLSLTSSDVQQSPLLRSFTLTRSTTSLPTATLVVPTATSVLPTATSVPPTVTPMAPTATSLPPTATSVVPTATSLPPTATPVVPTATPTPGSAIPGLVAAYNFDAGSGSSLADLSGRGHTGTLVNGPAWTSSGHTGAALSFDGVDDLVDIPDANDLDLSTGMTLAAWIYPTTIDAWQTVIFKTMGSNDLAYGLYAFSDGNNRPRSFINNGTQTDIGGGSRLPTNTWTHLATTYDGSVLRLYVNGQQVAQRNLSGSIQASTTALQLGGNTSYSGEWFHGRIDDVRIYNRALTAAEIVTDRDTPVANSSATATPTLVVPTPTSILPTATPVPATVTSILPTATPVPPTATPVLPTATLVPATATSILPTATPVPATATPVVPTSTPTPGSAIPGLVAAYNFDAGSGSSLADLSGRGHTGTLVNGPAWTPNGHTGSALSFDGVDDLVDIPDANDLDLTTGMTLAAWIYPTTIDAWQTVIFKTMGSNDLAYGLYAFSDGNNRPRSFINNGTQTDIGGGSRLPTNTWTHLATTYDGSVLRLYVNGQQVTQRNLSGSIQASTTALQLGGNTSYSGEWFHGRIDDVRIYNRALTAAEIVTDRDTPVP